MAFKSSKHQNVVPVQMVLNGGLNYASTPTNLADNELRRAHNFIYDPETDFLVTRPGTSCQTATAVGAAILNGLYYEKNATDKYHVSAAGGKLYYLTGASLDTFTEIGALTNSTDIPSFLTFNSKLLIADNGTAIRTWDGSSYTTLAGSPKATALATIGSRVVSNASDEPDSVYLSGPEDETDWDTVSGAAVGVKAGYGDGMSVVGFGVFGDDLIIFKKGDAEKRIYRLNVSDATPANWYVTLLSSNNTAQNHSATADAWSNVFFVDTNGFKSVKGVDVYGDLQVDPIGKKVNTVFSAQADCDFLTYLPNYNAIWFGLSERVFCYTEQRNADGEMVPAFTDLVFQQGRIRAVYQAGDDVFLCGNNGHIYKMNSAVATDETVPATTAAYVSALRTKTLAFGSDGILRKLQWYLRPKKSGTALLYAYKDEETEVLLKTVTLTNEGEYLYDATGDLADATDFLYDDGYYAWTETTRNRVRNDQMAFEIYLTSGRVGVEWVKAEIAMVEG